MTEHIRRDDKTGQGIAVLAEQSAKYREQTISVKARVVHAFPNIMGVNWIHVCDEPGGPVLVASSAQWAEPGSMITIRGTLTLDRNIADAYIFPLFVENAQLEGKGVQSLGPNAASSTLSL
jgi:hypothetical protein